MVEFHRDKSRKDGLRPQCKVCTSIPQIGYRKNNKEKISKRVKLWEKINKEYVRKTKKEYYKANKQHILNKQNSYYKEHREGRLAYIRTWEEINKENRVAYRKLWYKTNKEFLSSYRKENSGKRNSYEAKRRAKKLQATPHWLSKQDIKFIEQIYIYKHWLQSTFKIPLHIDHIVPLQGEEVSGLHVPWNLRIETAKTNMRKHNRVL